MTGRTPEQIRASIEANRQELGVAVDRLRAEVAEVTDWRRKVRDNQERIVPVAAAAGFLLGGGIAAFGGLIFRRR